jgi:cobalamin biosynthesis protein CobW
MTEVRKIPTTVVTGFLGAGKTSLIRHLLETANGRRLALIINEFGDLGVDGEILKGCGIEGCREDDVLELANGCICCTVAEDFVPTMERLLDRPDPPDHIVIETSGLALPKPLVKAFNWPEIRTRVTVDGVVAVIDGAAVADRRFAPDPEAVQAQREADEMLDHDNPLEEVFEDQLACADLVVLNKTDLLDEAELSRVRGEVGEQLRAAVKLVPIAHGQVPASVLLGLGAAAEDDLESRPSHHDGLDDHDHDDFTSFALELDAVTSPDELLARLAPVIARHDILRVKGFAEVTGKDMRLVVQGVGSRLNHYYDRDWRADERRGTRLVIIAQQGLDRAAVTASLTGPASG